MEEWKLIVITIILIIGFILAFDIYFKLKKAKEILIKQPMSSMKSLIKKYIEKGYNPTFYKSLAKTVIPCKLQYEKIPIEKLELYLMRDWLEEEKGVLVYEAQRGKLSELYHIEDIIIKTENYVINKYHDERVYKTRSEVLKSALNEAIKHVKSS